MNLFVLRQVLIFQIFIFGLPLAWGKPVVINVANSFYTNWYNTKEAAPAQRLQSFYENVAPQFSEFYDYRNNSLKKQSKDVDQEILRHLNEFSDISSDFLSLSRELPLIIESAAASFSETFRDFDSNFRVYLIHSLDEMDGGVRTLGDKDYFIFGLESMIKYHNFTNRTPFFHHELFHKYHFQYLKHEFNETLGEYLWIEGLATYMSHVLNPGASYTELTLDVPEGLVNRCEKNFSVIIEELLASFESKTSEIYTKFFLPNANYDVIRSRAAYYIGYLVAKEIAKTRPPLTLIKLSGDPLKQLMRQTLQQLRRKHENESYF